MVSRFDQLRLGTDGRLFVAGPVELDEGVVEDSVAVRFLIVQGEATVSGVGGLDGPGRWSGVVDTTGFSVGQRAIATGVLTATVDQQDVTGFIAISWSVALNIEEKADSVDGYDE